MRLLLLASIASKTDNLMPMSHANSFITPIPRLCCFARGGVGITRLVMLITSAATDDQAAEK